jgi:predicted AlkP superfamily phosphohydrolase/phosphomutase
VFYSEIQGDPELVNSVAAKRAFFDLMYHVDIRKSGMHHPDGIFWVNRAANEQSVKEQRVPLEAVAPTLLGLMGIKPPEWMKGKNLV